MPYGSPSLTCYVLLVQILFSHDKPMIDRKRNESGIEFTSLINVTDRDPMPLPWASRS